MSKTCENIGKKFQNNNILIIDFKKCIIVVHYPVEMDTKTET